MMLLKYIIQEEMDTNMTLLRDFSTSLEAIIYLKRTSRQKTVLLYLANISMVGSLTSLKLLWMEVLLQNSGLELNSSQMHNHSMDL